MKLQAVKLGQKVNDRFVPNTHTVILKTIQKLSVKSHACVYSHNNSDEVKLHPGHDRNSGSTVSHM